MSTKKSISGTPGDIPEALVQALADLSPSITALDTAVAALCGKAATRNRKPCAAQRFGRGTSGDTRWRPAHLPPAA